MAARKQQQQHHKYTLTRLLLALISTITVTAHTAAQRQILRSLLLPSLAVGRKYCNYKEIAFEHS